MTDVNVCQGRADLDAQAEGLSQRFGGLDGAFQRAGVNRFNRQLAEGPGEFGGLFAPAFVQVDAGQVSGQSVFLEVVVFAVADEEQGGHVNFVMCVLESAH